MAKREKQDGRRRQQDIIDAQHRPEQNRGYDEAVRGSADAPPSDVMDTDAVEGHPARREDAFDRAERDAINEVRRRERFGEQRIKE
jgi:hypothetical protein